MEYLKADLVRSVGELFKALIKGDIAEIADVISNIMIITFILGQRSGVSYETINQVLFDKLENTLKNVDSEQNWYQDLVDFRQYLEERKNRNR